MQTNISINNSEMTENMKSYAINLIIKLHENNNNIIEISKKIKDDFDKKYSPTWQCIIGNIMQSNIS